jgi:hypothetical protein
MLSEQPDFRQTVENNSIGFDASNRVDHDWSTRDALLGDPAPSVPALPGLFINNLSAPND